MKSRELVQVHTSNIDDGGHLRSPRTKLSKALALVVLITSLGITGVAVEHALTPQHSGGQILVSAPGPTNPDTQTFITLLKA
ncbi:MAG: hypothetical protein ACYDHP_09565 [Ferrimicrobium sp.]